MSWFATSDLFTSRAPSQATSPSPQVRAIRRSPFGSPFPYTVPLFRSRAMTAITRDLGD